MQESASAGRNGREQEDFLELQRRLEAGDLPPASRAAFEFGRAFTTAPETLTRAHQDALVEELGAVEVMIFVAWQASGLRAIHSWNADLLFGAPDVRLAYADGPSLFVADGAGPVGGGSAGRFVEVEEVVPCLRREWSWDPAALEAVREAWHGDGTPPDAWFEFLRQAPHVLWGWSEFHRLTFGEGVLPTRTKALALALLGGRLGHRRWVTGLVGRGGQAALTEGDVAAVEAGDLERFDAKTRAAMTYVGRLESDYLTVDDAFVADVATALSPGELIELGMFTGLHLGSIRLARLAAS